MAGVLHGLIAALAVRFKIEDSTVQDTEGTPTTAQASISVNRDGTVTFTGNGSDADYNWHTPAAGNPGDNYEINLTVDSGDAPTSGDSTATDLALTSNRTWTWTTTGIETLSASCTLTLKTPGGTTVDSGTISVTVLETA